MTEAATPLPNATGDSGTGVPPPMSDHAYGFSPSALPFPLYSDDGEKLKVGGGWVRIGRRSYTVKGGISVNLSGSLSVYVKVLHPNSSGDEYKPELVIGEWDTGISTESVSCIPVYKLEDGIVKEDWRFCPGIAMYE